MLGRHSFVPPDRHVYALVSPKTNLRRKQLIIILTGSSSLLTWGTQMVRNLWPKTCNLYYRGVIPGTSPMLCYVCPAELFSFNAAPSYICMCCVDSRCRQSTLCKIIYTWYHVVGTWYQDRRSLQVRGESRLYPWAQNDTW